MLEFANRLVARGHDVTFYVPEEQDRRCTWMRCDARVEHVRAGLDDELDVLLFNDERQWHLLDLFTRARRRVFYALHHAALYGKEGAWESVRAAVDLQLANSSWTADQIAAETGHRPTVQLGGVNRDVFRPYGGRKRYPVLCMGGDRRPWKGTDTILEAGRLLDLPVETYAGKNLAQGDLGREYDAASVFCVGSWFEGFCQPGLEALACGVPLVTTDNGGCREYALDRETALVVPPRDPAAMAEAIRSVLDDPAFARELAAKGLDLVARDFDWERRTDELAVVLDGVSAGTALAPPPPRPAPPDDPELSVVVLAWDNLSLTQACVESMRRNTDVAAELVIVDNGSAWDAAGYARSSADRAVLNDENQGFARGMNQGLAATRGAWVAFCNNDIELPPGWAGRLLETARRFPSAGIVVPALTAARSSPTVRAEPGDEVEILPPFSAPPPAVVYLMRSEIARELGGFGEEYEVASGEDVDLAFKVWVNDLEIVYDQRVLVAHVGKATASRHDDWRELWRANRRRFIDKWSGDTPVVRLASCAPDRFERNRATSRAVAQWMDEVFTVRDRVTPRRRWRAMGRRARRRLAAYSRSSWRRVRPHLPPRLVDSLGRAGRRVLP